jgi:hypothetical protein
LEYKIIARKVDNAFVRNVDKAAKDLSRQVTEQLGAGWEPLGNVTLGNAGTAPYLLQALVKRR